MLKVEINHQIILMFYREGLSQREIAKELKIHRRTVKARIDQYDQFKASPLSDADKPLSLFNKYLKTGAVYDSSNRVKRRLTDDIIAIVDKHLQENEEKRGDGRMKQRLKKIDIHEQILNAGYSISYSVLCDYISKKVRASQEAFIRQEYAEGSCCEFDWAEVRLNLDGTFRRYYMALFTSACTNYRYSMLFQRQDTLAFKESHICFFDHTAGVYKQMVYDNMRVAIANFVGTEKVPTEALLQLSRWYKYDWRFCNIAKGNEKGHVERSVEYVRRRVFGVRDTFKSFQEAQEYLLSGVKVLNNRPGKDKGLSPAARFELERKALYTSPERMECFAGENLKVDKYSTVSFGTNRYSVPDHLIGKMVFAKIYSHKIKFYDDNNPLCAHNRLYERHGWQIELNHYLITLQRKPGAVAGSVALKQAPEWVQLMYSNHFVHNARSFIELLQYCQANDIDSTRVCDCVSDLSGKFPNGVTSTHIIALLGNQQAEEAILYQEPNAITLQALENLVQLEAMMNCN